MSLKDLLLLVVWFVLRPFLKIIPIGLLYKVAGVCSVVYYALSPGSKRVYMEELGMLFPDKDVKELKTIIKKSFGIHFKRQVENLIFNRFTKEFIDRNISIEGIEHLDAALSKGKGAIVLVAHFGSFLFAPLALTYKNYKTTQLTAGPGIATALTPAYHIISEKKLSESVDHPINFLRADQSLAEVFKILEKNELLVVAIDGRHGKNWVEAEMFGRKAMLLPGPVRIAIKGGSPIIPAFMIRNDDDTQRLVFEPAVEMQIFEDKKEAVLINIQRLASIFERYISKYPCHYARALQIMRLKHKLGQIEYPLVP